MHHKSRKDNLDKVLQKPHSSERSVWLGNDKAVLRKKSPDIENKLFEKVKKKQTKKRASKNGKSKSNSVESLQDMQHTESKNELLSKNER